MNETKDTPTLEADLKVMTGRPCDAVDDVTAPEGARCGGPLCETCQAAARVLERFRLLEADNAVLLSLVRRAIYGKADRSCTECGRKDVCAEGCAMARADAAHHPGAYLLEELRTLHEQVERLGLLAQTARDEALAAASGSRAELTSALRQATDMLRNLADNVLTLPHADAARTVARHLEDVRKRHEG